MNSDDVLEGPNYFAKLCDLLAHGTQEEKGAAVAEILRRYGEFLKLLTRKRMLTGSPVDVMHGASDIMSSVYGNLMNLDLSNWEFQSKEELMALLNTVIKNKLIDKIRESKALKRRPTGGIASLNAGRDDGANQDVPDRATATPSVQIRRVEYAAVLKSKREAVRQCLSVEEFQLLERHYVHEVPQADLALELGISETALRMRLQRIRNKVKEQLKLPEDELNC